ncbi:MAG: hypothetical protein U0797_15035 [Gemmataceae bacterium]
MPFEDLYRKSRERLGRTHDEATGEDRSELAGTLLKLYSVGGVGLVEFWRCYPTFSTRVSDKPVAAPVARMMAEENQAVATMRHQCIVLNDLDRQLIPMLDGSHTRLSMRTKLLEAFNQGQINLARQGQPIKEEHKARPILTEMIDQQLARYAETGLLIA